MNSQNNTPGKKMKKLTLKLNTVKNLSAPDLANVVGGALPNSFPQLVHRQL